MEVDGPTPIMTDHNSRNGTATRLLLKCEDSTYLMKELDEDNKVLYEEPAETWEEGLIAFSIRSGHAVRKEHFEKRGEVDKPIPLKRTKKKGSDDIDLDELLIIS